MRHMELLSHFLLHTAPDIGRGKEVNARPLNAVLRAAYSAPYLMCQILALSALHMGHIEETQSEKCHVEAVALQAQGLSLFQDDLGDITTNNCVPMFMFANFLSLHTLSEAVLESQDDADGFLDRFITYLNLQRGVQTMCRESWSLLLQSDLSPLLVDAGAYLDDASLQPEKHAPNISVHLYSLLDQADMGKEAETDCRDAIARLQLLLNAEAASKDSHQPEGLISAWPVLLPVTFTEMLMKRKPEALIILCYYAVLLHNRRSLWLIQNAGELLITSISKFLGSYWRSWLDWPIQMLEETG